MAGFSAGSVKRISRAVKRSEATPQGGKPGDRGGSAANWNPGVGWANSGAGLAAGATMTGDVSDVDGVVIVPGATIKNRVDMPAVPANVLMILAWSSGKWAVQGWGC